MTRSLPGNFGMFFVEFRKERAQTRKWRGPDKEGKENIVFLCDFCFAFTLRKSRTYTQIHTPPRYNGVRGEGGWVDRTSLRSLWYVAVFRNDFTFSGKPLVLNKMRCILWVVALLEAFNVTNNGRHLVGLIDILTLPFNSRYLQLCAFLCVVFVRQFPL